MADRYGINLGNVLSTVENIQSARLTNKFNALKLAGAERAETDDNALRAAQSGAYTSPQNPTGSAGVQGFIEELDEKKLGDALKANDANLRAFHYIAEAEDKEAAWLEVKEAMPADVQKNMPATFDAEWLKASQGKSYLMQQLLEAKTGAAEDAKPYTDAAKIEADFRAGFIDRATADEAMAALKTTATDLIKDAPSGYQWTDGNRTALVPVPGGPKDPKAGGAQIDVTAANAIRGTVVQAFGGVYDPITGGFSGLDPAQGKRAVDTMALAEQYYADGLNPAQAVQKAMAEMGGIAPNETSGTDTGNDPLGIR